MILNIELWKLLHNKPELDLKIIMDNYITLIYTLVFNKLSIRSSKEEIEKCVNEVFLEVFNYKNGVDLQKDFIKVFLTSIAKRKIIDGIYRRNKNNDQTAMDNISVQLNNLGDDVLRSILLKDTGSQLIDDIKSVSEPNSQIITRNYYLNQSLKDISKNTGLKVSAYA